MDPLFRLYRYYYHNRNFINNFGLYMYGETYYQIVLWPFNRLYILYICGMLWIMHRFTIKEKNT
jgi:hypothetical protein